MPNQRPKTDLLLWITCVATAVLISLLMNRSWAGAGSEDAKPADPRTTDPRIARLERQLAHLEAEIERLGIQSPANASSPSPSAREVVSAHVEDALAELARRVDQLEGEWDVPADRIRLLDELDRSERRRQQDQSEAETFVNALFSDF